MLWVGPLNSNRLSSSLVERRDAGTPEAEPCTPAGWWSGSPATLRTWRSRPPPRSRCGCRTCSTYQTPSSGVVRHDRR
ncbi:MAG: hypothetical protein M3186_07505 [Actinomycetota bacterium]|nr:hypothetical protein [Actinomycetota bacterium]